MRKIITAAAAALLVLSACSKSETSTDTGDKAATKASVETVSAASIIKADNSSWLSYGRTYNEQRFSPLTKVSADNVGELFR